MVRKTVDRILKILALLGLPADLRLLWNLVVPLVPTLIAGIFTYAQDASVPVLALLILGLYFLLLLASIPITQLISSLQSKRNTEDGGMPTSSQAIQNATIKPTPSGSIWIKDTATDRKENQALKAQIFFLKREIKKLRGYKEQVSLGLRLREAHGKGSQLYEKRPSEQDIADWLSKTHKLIQDGLGEKEASLFLSNEGLSEHPMGTAGQKKIAPRLTRLQHILNRQAYLKRNR